MLKNYKELNVWQKSYQLCLEIYKATKTFPKNERLWLDLPNDKGGPVYPEQYYRRVWEKNNPGIFKIIVRVRAKAGCWKKISPAFYTELTK